MRLGLAQLGELRHLDAERGRVLLERGVHVDDDAELLERPRLLVGDGLGDLIERVGDVDPRELGLLAGDLHELDDLLGLEALIQRLRGGDHHVGRIEDAAGRLVHLRARGHRPTRPRIAEAGEGVLLHLRLEPELRRLRGEGLRLPDGLHEQVAEREAGEDLEDVLGGPPERGQRLLALAAASDDILCESLGFCWRDPRTP